MPSPAPAEGESRIPEEGECTPTGSLSSLKESLAHPEQLSFAVGSQTGAEQGLLLEPPCRETPELPLHQTDAAASTEVCVCIFRFSFLSSLITQN